MSLPNWTHIGDYDIPAKPAGGLWTLVHEHFEGPCRLKITVSPEQTWRFADEAEAQCGPDGNPVSHLPGSLCLNTNAPIGALVGKIGGSTADKTGVVDFVAGGFCVVVLDDATKSGPLFLTINDLPAS